MLHWRHVDYGIHPRWDESRPNPVVLKGGARLHLDDGPCLDFRLGSVVFRSTGTDLPIVHHDCRPLLWQLFTRGDENSYEYRWVFPNHWPKFNNFRGQKDSGRGHAPCTIPSDFLCDVETVVCVNP